MNVRDNKGAITVFVLIGLLFMTSFLMISFGNNINRSKTAKEQSNMITGIYSLGDGDAGAYKRAYTAIRKKNADILTAFSEDSSTLELTKTFDDKLTGYKIYGNSIQDTETNGAPSPTNPVEVQSVGDKTINLANNYDVRESSSTVGALNGATIDSEYIDIVRQTTYDYTFVPVSLVAGKTYTVYYEYEIYGRAEGDTGRTTVGLGFQANAIKTNNYYANATDRYVQTYTPTEDGSVNVRVFANYGSPTPAKVKFKVMVVEGEYTLDTIPAYEPYGYKIPVRISGKNLLNTYGYSATTIATADTNRNLTNGYGTTISTTEPSTSLKVTQSTYNTTDSADHYRNGYFCIGLNDELEIGKRYNISFDLLIENNPLGANEIGVRANTIGALRLPIDKDNTGVQRISGSFIYYENGENRHMTIRCMGMSFTISNIMITEENETSTIYEPSIEPITTNIYLDEPLRKIGDYTDYIDFKSGKIFRQVQESIYTGEEDWKLLGTVASTNYYYYLRVGDFATIQQKVGLNTHFERKDITTSIAGVLGYNPVNSSTYNEDRIIIRPDMTVYTDVTLWKNYLASQYSSGTPVKAYYALADYTMNRIALTELSTFEDYTRIEVLTEIAPSKIEATYRGYTME